MRNPSTRSWPRRIIRFVAGLFVVLLITLSILYFRQHSLVYHPRPYDESYVYALPANGLEINYTVATAKYVAYYVPGIHPTPKRLWIAFCGNGSVALDFAANHRVQKIVLIAPFTTLREEAATIFGGWMARMLIESYDNRAHLAQTRKRNPDAQAQFFTARTTK